MTHQQYLDARAELNDLISRKKIVDRNLVRENSCMVLSDQTGLRRIYHSAGVLNLFLASAARTLFLGWSGEQHLRL